MDDVTAESSGLAYHRAHLAKALNGADPDLPVLLLAHQPKFVDRAAAHGIDLQLSGHTHGGQIWPFHHLVRIDQPALGLSRHGSRTLLYTSRGTGFWGPPFRVFAPSEITLLVLRSPQHPPPHNARQTNNTARTAPAGEMVPVGSQSWSTRQSAVRTELPPRRGNVHGAR